MNDVTIGLARRNLLREPIRLALSVAGVALAIMLILLLGGLMTGTNNQISAYLDHEPGSIVVGQQGVRNVLGATSLLPAGTTARVRRVKGVGEVIPLLSQFVILDLHGVKGPAYLVGYDPGRGGGPWQLAAGRAPRSASVGYPEVVFDRVLAEQRGVTLGSVVNLMGTRFRVVGLSSGTTTWMTSYFFLTRSAAAALLRQPDATSFLLVTPSRGTSPDVLLRRLQAVPGIEVVPKSTMIADDRALFSKVLNIALGWMVGIAFLVGVLVVGLVIYTATVERQREYGVLKAIGARNGLLYRVVAGQALIATGVGSALGVALSFITAQLIMAMRPQFLIVLAPDAALRAIVIGALMALVAALVPSRAVARLAPADVFRR
jgi:putative ABC transport system permease protein